MSTPDPFQELVDVLRRALTSNPSASPPAITSANTTVTPSPPVYASPMAKPAPFSGSAEDCNGFLLQCSLVLEMQPHLYPDDHTKVAFIISQLNGRELQWAETTWSQNGSVSQSLTSFMTHFKEVFGRPAGDSSIVVSRRAPGPAAIYIIPPPSRIHQPSRTNQLTQRLCLYRGAPGPVISACPTRPPRPMSMLSSTPGQLVTSSLAPSAASSNSRPQSRCPPTRSTQ
ncbi:Retrotransposon-derived protein PEG10 [Anabarilius grahami]|uniref:Retrotransposon-derived protein PEG10 n=1 Tax=Anabarilius grahami TaxID=495550 RepID=A0A3N0YPA7_ANAGA|nr:Retrotransposon-derived protein PEG10 [Anabarilius grahami]